MVTGPRYARILLKIKEEWPQSIINLYDDSDRHVGHQGMERARETHFTLTLTLKKKDISPQSRIKVHRRIYSLLTEEFQTGLHALSIKVEPHD